MKEKQVGDQFTGTVKLAAKDAVRDAIKFGKFYKKGSKQGIKEWRKRLFVLTSDKLYYYKAITDKSQTGVLDIKNTSITRCDTEIERKNAFKITGFQDEPDRVFYAYCESEQDVSSWLIALTNASGTCIVVSQTPTQEQLQSNRVFRTIQEAINVAQGGEKIKVYEGVYKEQLIIDKIIVLEGVVSDEAIAKQNELKQDYEKEMQKRKEREEKERQAKLNLNPEILRQQMELEKQKELIQLKLRGMSFRERRQSSLTSPRASVSQFGYGEAQPQEVSHSSFITHGNISNVVLEAPTGDAAVVYRSSGGSISNFTFRMGSDVASQPKKLNELVTSEDDPMISCLEIENGQLSLHNCSIRCNSGSGLLCMNRSVINMQNCDISEVRDMGIWSWDRSSVSAMETRISVVGTNGLQANGNSKIKLERCHISSCGLFGVCIADTSECVVQSCDIKQINADGIRIQNGAKCQVRISELQECNEYGMSVYNNMDGCSATITEDCKFNNNKMGDFMNRELVRLER